MTLFQALLLGLVQGITEFLPISSSGHLVLVPFLLGWEITPELVFPFGILVQLGTLVAVFIYFRGNLQQIIQNFLNGLRTRNFFEHPDSALGWKLIGATIPAGAIGLAFNGSVKTAFQKPCPDCSRFVRYCRALIHQRTYRGKDRRNCKHGLERCFMGRFFFRRWQSFPVFQGPVQPSREG